MSSLAGHAYTRAPGREVFIEVRPNFGSPTFRDRLYLMLSKIEHYRGRSNIEARLDLVVLRLPSRPAPSYQARLIEDFQPAIASGLLPIAEITLSEAEEAELPKEAG